MLPTGSDTFRKVEHIQLRVRFRDPHTHPSPHPGDYQLAFVTPGIRPFEAIWNWDTADAEQAKYSPWDDP